MVWIEKVRLDPWRQSFTGSGLTIHRVIAHVVLAFSHVTAAGSGNVLFEEDNLRSFRPSCDHFRLFVAVKLAKASHYRCEPRRPLGLPELLLYEVVNNLVFDDSLPWAVHRSCASPPIARMMLEEVVSHYLSPSVFLYRHRDIPCRKIKLRV